MDSSFTKEQKKKHKGLIGIIIGVVLCLSILPVTVFAEGGLSSSASNSGEEAVLAEQSIAQVNEEQAGGSSTKPDEALSQTTDNKTSQDQSSTQDSNTSSTQTDEALSEQDLTDPDGTNEEGLIIAAASDTQTDASVAKVEANGSTIFYDTVEEAFAAANASGTATITLLKDCTAPASSTLTSSGNDITLDLAGYTLTGNGQTSVITVAANTTFTLNDSTGTNQGTITGGRGKDVGSNFLYRQAGGGILVFSGATFTMEGGTISGNAGMNGGGVYVYRSTFIMEDGLITENIGASRGGGVCVANGIFTMNGGTISKNSTSINSTSVVVAAQGGGVFASDSFTLNEGTISENTSIYGGGVYGDAGFTMNGGTISDNTAECGGGAEGGTLTMNGGKISGNTAISNIGGSGGITSEPGLGGGIHATTFYLNAGIISNNTGFAGGGIFASHFYATGGTISGNVATDGYRYNSGGGVCCGDDIDISGSTTITGNRAEAGSGGGIYYNGSQIGKISGSVTITGNKAREGAGGVMCAFGPLGSSPIAFSGQPTITGNIAASEEEIADKAVETTEVNVGILDDAPLYIGEGLSDGAKIGITVYDSNRITLSSADHFIYRNYPTFTSPVQFTTAEADTSYYADSSKYFFSDNPNYGVRINSDDKYLELAPALTVTFNTQGGDLPLGASDTKTVVYGATYGELPTPTKSGFHFAAWSLSESDTGEHLHVGEDSEVTEKTDHTLYAHWQEKEVPEIDFSIPQVYDYDGKEHPFIFSVVDGPDIDDGLWEIYYFEHTGEFHEKPTDRSEFSTTPPKDVDDYCVVITHPETDQYAYFESEFIHNGIIIKAVDCTLSFETNGGSVIDPHKDKTGNTIDLSEFTTTKEGYSFTGWYRDEALTDKIESITLIGDTTVYAGWEEAPTPTAAPTEDNSDESSDDGSTLPLMGSALHLGLLLLVLCALAVALVTPLVVKRKRKKLDF